MSELQTALKEYLAVRRALGFKLEKVGRMLEDFVDFLKRQRASVVTRDLAVRRWAMNSGVKE